MTATYTRLPAQVWLAAMARFAQTPPLNYEGLIGALGAKLVVSELRREVASLYMTGERHDIIQVNALLNEEERRIAAAHAIGHLMMHRDEIGDSIHTDFVDRTIDHGVKTLSDNDEARADQLASSILMERVALKQALETSDKPADLAKLFGVTETYAEARCRQALGEGAASR